MKHCFLCRLIETLFLVDADMFSYNNKQNKSKAEKYQQHKASYALNFNENKTKNEWVRENVLLSNWIVQIASVTMALLLLSSSSFIFFVVALHCHRNRLFDVVAMRFFFLSFFLPSNREIIPRAAPNRLFATLTFYRIHWTNMELTCKCQIDRPRW